VEEVLQAKLQLEQQLREVTEKLEKEKQAHTIEVVGRRNLLWVCTNFNNTHTRYTWLHTAGECIGEAQCDGERAVKERDVAQNPRDETQSIGHDGGPTAHHD
jgi:hypothetical protein